MSDITFNFGLLLKLGMYIFLPVVILIFVSRMIILLCTRKIKRTDEEKYYRIINCWTSFVAIIITIALLIVTIVYAYYFINTMKARGLVSRNKIIYYLVLVFPVIPFSFLIYYIVGLIRMGRIHHDTKDFEDEPTIYHSSTEEDHFQLPKTDAKDAIYSQFELPVENSIENSKDEKQESNDEIEML